MRRGRFLSYSSMMISVKLWIASKESVKDVVALKTFILCQIRLNHKKSMKTGQRTDIRIQRTEDLRMEHNIAYL